MANAEDEAARQRYYVAYLNRGTTRNVEILDEVMALRHELAGLYELPSFAHFVLRRRMAGNPEAVNRFLDEVRAAVEEAERRDLDELRALKAERLGRPANGQVAGRPAGTSRFSASGCASSATASTRNRCASTSRRRPTLDWLLDVSGEVFGLRFVPGHGAGVARGRRSTSTCSTATTAASSAASTSTSIRATASSRTPRRGRCAASARAPGARRSACWSRTSIAAA